jgi:hypothetical protein
MAADRWLGYNALHASRYKLQANTELQAWGFKLQMKTEPFSMFCQLK